MRSRCWGRSALSLTRQREHSTVVRNPAAIPGGWDIPPHLQSPAGGHGSPVGPLVYLTVLQGHPHLRSLVPLWETPGFPLVALSCRKQRVKLCQFLRWREETLSLLQNLLRAVFHWTKGLLPSSCWWYHRGTWRQNSFTPDLWHLPWDSESSGTVPCSPALLLIHW